MKREIVNGSLEPLWRANARSDADKFKAELLRSPGRRKFLGGVGAALMLEYVATRRAIALPLFHAGGPSANSGTIYNARLGPGSSGGTDYPNIPAALVAMQSNDTIMLPAGTTYKYLGTTYNYALWQNSTSINYGATAGSGFNSMFLGSSTTHADYDAILPNADYGSIQAYGSANNGRALISPPYGILASPYHNGDTEMFFVGSTPASNWGTTANTMGIYVDPAYNFGEFSTVSLTYTGIDTIGNGLTGIGGSISTTIPAGTIVAQYLGASLQAQAIFVANGSNPGWTFTNLELAYAMSSATTVGAIRQQSSLPGDAVGSMTLNNCYIHNHTQGPGEGYCGPGPVAVFAHLFDTEITQCGSNGGQTHNLYIGHIGELILDNCWIHDTSGTWNVKSRAALSILTYNQIRGERSDTNPDIFGNPAQGSENGGCDFSNGGLAYLIGNIHQLSLNGRNNLINWNAESSPVGNSFNNSWIAGGPNSYQELYCINCTLIGPSSGTAPSPYFGGPGWGALHVYGIGGFSLGVSQPQFTVLGQTTGGGSPNPTQYARQYWVAFTNVGTGGGESLASNLTSPYGNAVAYVSEYLNISANNVLTVPTVLAGTGYTSWNCYANYGDPIVYGPPASYNNSGYTGPFADLTHSFWDSANTLPIFGTTSGATTISVTGTVTGGFSQTITSVSALSGIGSLSQLVGLTPYVSGVSLHCFVQSVDEATATLTLSQGISSSSTGTITFGYLLWCGFTYATALGDSVNIALTNGLGVGNLSVSPSGSYDGSLTAHQYFYLGAIAQVPPGEKLIVNAPPSAGSPAWATGINFWAVALAQNDAGGGTVVGMGISGTTDGNVFGMSKQNSTTILFGNSYTTPANIFLRGAQTQPNLYLQNASPIAQGTNFTEPSTGLANHNPTAGKLQWYRRAGVQAASGATMDCWYAVVPTGGLSSYSDAIYMNQPCDFTGSVSVWRGCAAGVFDSNFPGPACSNDAQPITVNSASGNVTVLSAIRSSGTAASGWTQISTASLMNASYKASTGAVSGLSVTETGGSSSDTLVCDILVGSSAPPTLISSVAVSGSDTQTVNFTISSANAGDVLYLMLGEDSTANVTALGKISTPAYCSAQTGSPALLLQNDILANFNQAQTNGVSVFGDNSVLTPSGAVTTITNQTANPYNGSTYFAPIWSTVFANATQSNFVYTLASGSPALGAATGPGSSREGQSLVPVSQVSWSGSPTPGTPIPAKTARSDISNASGTSPFTGPTAGAIGALS